MKLSSLKRKNEHDIYQKFGIYSPLISKPIIQRRQALFHSSSSAEKGTLYECMKMCSFCHDIYLLYENKMKNCKDSFHLIKKQVSLFS